MIMLFSLILFMPGVSHAVTCDALVSSLNTLTARFTSLRPELKKDYEKGTRLVDNDVDLATTDFLDLKDKTCREKAFGPWLNLGLASVPFSFDGATAGLTEDFLARHKSFASAYALGLADFKRASQGDRALNCRAQRFEEQVQGHKCLRDHPKKSDCFANAVDFATCANLPALGSR